MTTSSPGFTGSGSVLYLARELLHGFNRFFNNTLIPIHAALLKYLSKFV
jgi:hypothetical protein